MRTALAVALALALGGTAAAKVDPVAVVMQASLKKALQTALRKQVPGMKVTFVKCTVGKNVRRGRCRANFTYKTVTGYYVLNVKQPATGPLSYRSTALHCFDAKSGEAASC